MQAAENEEVDGVLGEQLAVARGEEHGEELGVGQHAALALVVIYFLIVFLYYYKSLLR